MTIVKNLVAALMLAAVCCCLEAAPRAEEPAALERQFPEIARLVRHFGARMRSKEPAVRLDVLTELTYFHPRDSRLYPPFLRYLLKDPCPKIRWQAVHRLRQHGIFLKKQELPGSYEVPMVGLCRPNDPDSLARLRKMLSEPDHPRAGWAVTALAAAKDEGLLEPAKRLTDSGNVFVRFSAAAAYLELGRREEALRLLQAIADTDNEPSGCYKLWAAELMVRHGRREYIGTMIDATASRQGQGYADPGISLLEDLTGRYFGTAAEWRAWWKRTHPAKPRKRGQQDPGARPTQGPGIDPRPRRDAGGNP